MGFDVFHTAIDELQIALSFDLLLHRSTYFDLSHDESPVTGAPFHATGVMRPERDERTRFN